MGVIYAQLNEEKICEGISQLSGEVVAEHMIELETVDDSLIGTRYNDGIWEEVAPEEPEISDEYKEHYGNFVSEVEAAIVEGVNDV